jgi:hypothetical protein
MKLIRNFRLRRIHAFVLGAIAAYCSMKIVDHISNVTSPTAFTFESYQNGTDAKARLLHLFPIGSNADVFLDFLRQRGAFISPEMKSRKFPNLSYSDATHNELRSYSLVAVMQWYISITIDENRKIVDYSVTRHISGL